MSGPSAAKQPAGVAEFLSLRRRKSLISVNRFMKKWASECLPLTWSPSSASFRIETMNKAFCQCGRECEWPKTHEEALCPCGTVNEPQTTMERNDKRLMHLARLQRINVRPAYFHEPLST
jgi:hypothetical protein